MKISLAKAWFVLSVGVLGVSYGIVANQWGWFPSPQLSRAWSQAEASEWLGPPDNVDGPRVYDRKGVTIIEQDEMQPGLTLITSWWEGTQRVKLVDQTGQVVHEWETSGSKLFPDSIDTEDYPGDRVLHGTHLFPDGDLLVNVEYVGTARLNACGNVRWQLAGNNHHSISRSEDGFFWIPGRNTYPETPKTFPGIGQVSFLEQIRRISEEGEVVDRINVLDVIFQNDLEHYLARFERVTHLNDVEPLSTSLADEYPLFEPGDLLVSLRDVNLVFVFNPTSGVVKWHSSKPFIAQHDPDFNGGGWIGIFDNRRDGTDRGSMLGGSRIIAIQPHTDSTKVLFPTDKSEPFYTSIRGKWQMLENGNMLLTESQTGRVVEVTRSGQTVWEWIHEPYDDSSVPVVTKATRVDLTREDVAPWPCSSVDSVSTSTQSK